MADQAFYPREPSASNASKVVDITKLPLFRGDDETEPFDEERHLYDLEALARFLCVRSFIGGHEDVAERCVKAIAEQCGVKVNTRRNREVQLTSKLPPLVTSTHERADVLVYNKEDTKVVLLVEVNSSPMLYTERKAVLGAADMLRLLRHTDKNFSVFTSFVFPKKECPQCVIKVTVKWQNLRFRYALQRLQDRQQAVGEVQAVLIHQMSAVPTLPKEIKPQLMLLSQDELNGLSSDAPVQLPSQRNIVVADAKYIYKVLCDVESVMNLALLNLFVAGQPKHFVLPCPLRDKATLFKYEKVHYSPLEVKDARKVLQTLAEKIKAALDELHEQGFMHCDVRLPNICFNEQLDAVLIDVDRACRTNDVTWYGVVHSCMYKVPRGARDTFCLDFMQLGWLLAWVLHPEGAYHKRTWEDLPQRVRKDQFLSDLLNCGQYSQAKLMESTVIYDADLFETVFN